MFHIPSTREQEIKMKEKEREEKTQKEADENYKILKETYGEESRQDAFSLNQQYSQKRHAPSSRISEKTKRHLPQTIKGFHTAEFDDGTKIRFIYVKDNFPEIYRIVNIQPGEHQILYGDYAIVDSHNPTFATTEGREYAPTVNRKLFKQIDSVRNELIEADRQYLEGEEAFYRDVSLQNKKRKIGGKKSMKMKRKNKKTCKKYKNIR